MPNNSFDRSGGSVLRIKPGLRSLIDNAPPGQLKRYIAISMSQPVRVGSIDVSERELFLLSTPSIRNPGGDLDLSSKYFGVLLVCDAERVENALIAQLADSLLAQGMRYFCSWGNDCERVHDLVDEVIVGGGYEPERSVIMTMWFAEESLDEALWQFLYTAFPANEYEANCQSALVIVVGNRQWEEQIKQRVSDLNGPNRDVVGEDEGDDI